MATSFEKNADTLFSPASTIKILSALVFRDWVLDADLDDLVTVTSADMFPPSTADLEEDDIISWRDLAYGMMLPSGNDASLCIGRNVGELILADEGSPSGTGLARFLTAMGEKLTSLSMTDAIADSTHGVDTTSRLSPRQVAQLLMLAGQDSFLRTVMGALTHTMTITGPNARTYSVSHTVDPTGAGGGTAFPEFILAKTGTYIGVAEYCVAMMWEKPEGGDGVSVVMYAPSSDQRFADLRAIMDYEIMKLTLS